MRFILLALLLVARVSVAADHPGNVHVVGEEVQIDVPEMWAGWRAVDVDGNEVARGVDGDRTAKLGKLPIGYYEVREHDGPGIVTAAVLAKIVPAENSPIALDAAMSWFYAEPEQIRGACTLCRLAGVRWVRDRLSWPEIETARGVWAAETRYERAMRIQHKEGLKILQVDHISPPWATSNPAHFPEDLRDVYNFYRGLAKRWKGLVDAIEPWNEPDLELFGGHTGCEIASFQKVAYLGLKAGDPQLPACQSVWAIDRAETLDEFARNDVQPYFDTYNLHHYTGLPAYPRVYGRHRALSGGKPMWTTEFNLPVHWADEATKEPSEEDLRVQGYRVGKVFAGALHEGSENAFYFILGHYVERNIQYGLVHTDLTPRPAYVAFAAVGRLLNGARPIGRVDLGDEKLKAFAFSTVVDGAEQETLVAWSETQKTKIKTGSATNVCDYLGREMPLRKKVELSRATVFLVMPRGAAKELKLVPPPAKPERCAGEPCTVVLQLVGKPDCDRSAFQLEASNSLRLVAYNFGDQVARGELDVEGASGATDNLTLEPGERKEWTLKANGNQPVTARFDTTDAGRAVVSANVLPMTTTKADP